MKPQTKPPHLADKLLKFFCAPHLLEEVQGDLHEEFDCQVKRIGVRRARWLYWWEIVGFMKPRYIKRKTTVHRHGPYPTTYLISPTMLRNYFKIAFRNLVRNKGYVGINLMGLGLGMTCAILIFCLVKYHLSFDDFHPNSNRIYRIVTELHRDNIDYTSSVPNPLGKAFRDDYTFGEKVARIATFDQQLITVKNGKEIKKFKEAQGIAFAEEDFFDLFNFPLTAGNKQSVLNEPNTAILTEKMAEKYFGHENPLNKIIRIDNQIDVKITGILKNLPVNTDRKTEIYISYSTLKSYNEWFANEESWGGIRSAMQCFVRLRPGISPAQAEAVLPTYVAKHRPKAKTIHHYKLQPLADIHFDARYGGPMEKRNLWILAFIGVFLVITACVNFINLATAQALKRSKEVGVRKVLGSVKGQLFGQFMAETGLITALSMVIALGLSFLVLPYVNVLFKTQLSMNLLSDWQLLLFIPALAILVTFLSGCYLGLIAAGFQPIVALKGKLSHQNIGGFNTRRTLIITQFALSQVLIIGMVVIANQMRYAKQSDLGFTKDAVVLIPITDRINSEAKGTSINTLKNQLSQLSGVEQVSVCHAAPSSENNWTTSVNYDRRAEAEPFNITVRAGDNHYLPTFDLKLVAGRNLFLSDSSREFVVNETFVRKLNLSSPEEAIGKMVGLNGGKVVGPIVGVVKDFHDRSFHEDINAVCISSLNEEYKTYAVKINGSNVKHTLAALEKTWLQNYPDRIYEYRFLDENIASFYETEETMFKLIELFSFIAIFIGCLGLYGLVSFMVAQKTKEIGIRKVLGGSISHILWIFGREFSRLILFAFVIAAPIGWWLMNNWLQDFKFHIAISSRHFVLPIASTFAVASLTIGYQAIKAALMNPVKSLKTE